MVSRLDSLLIQLKEIRSKDRLYTKIESEDELLYRGWRRDSYPGIWVSPDNNKYAWFNAVNKEKIKIKK